MLYNLSKRRENKSYSMCNQKHAVGDNLRKIIAKKDGVHVHNSDIMREEVRLIEYCAGPPKQCCHEPQQQERQDCSQGGAQLSGFQLQQRVHQGVHGLPGGLLHRLDLTQLVINIICLHAPYVYNMFFCCVY